MFSTKTNDGVFLKREAVYFIFKHQWFILSMLLITALMAVGLHFYIGKEYEASSKILIKFGRERLFSNLVTNQEPYVTSQLRTEDINSEIEIITSPDLLLQLVEHRGVNDFLKKSEYTDPKQQAQEALEIIQNELSVSQVVNTDVIQISYQAKDPKRAADIVNELTKLYLDKHIQVHSSARITKFLIEQEAEASQALALIEEKIKTFYAGTKDKSTGYSSPLSPGTFRSQATESVSLMENKILELEFEKKKLLTKYQPRSQPVIEINQQIADIREMLKKERPLYASKDKQYNDLQRQKTMAENRRNMYKRKLEEALIQKEMDQNKIISIHIISQAFPPLDPKSLSLVWRLFLALFIGTILTAVLLILQYALDDTFYTAEQLENLSACPLVVSIPYSSSERKKSYASPK